MSESQPHLYHLYRGEFGKPRSFKRVREEQPLPASAAYERARQLTRNGDGTYVVRPVVRKGAKA